MRKRYWPVLALVAISLFTVAFAGDLRQNPQAAKAGAPAELNALMTQAVAAANSRDPRAFAPLAEGDAARRFAWARSQTSHWQGGILTAPTPSGPPIYLAVFHAWHTCESDGDHIHTLAQTPQGWRLGPEIPETETGGFRLRDHDAQVRLDVPKQRAAIADHVRIEGIGADAPPFGLLRLSPDFRVTTLNLGKSDGPAVPFQQVGGIIAFAPPAENSFTLSMKYAGVVHHQESDYITTNEATLNSYWLPHTARLPATATITVTTPPGWDALAPGERIRERRSADGALVVTYRNDLPISFYTLDAGRYTITKRLYKNRTLATYFLRPDAAFAQRCLDRLERAMAFYEAHFGPFPYTRYSLVQTQGAFAGALESYSFATFGPRTLPDYIAHELAHTWWGGLVPCTYTRSMWNESFASYSDDLFQRLTARPARGFGARTASASSTRRAARRLNPAHYTVPLTEAHDTSDERHITVGYGKGTQVLRVLEAQIGQETMLRCLAAFARTHSRGAPAEWSDFEAAVRQVTGKDYRWFFAEWTERPGLPAVWLTDVTARRGGNGETFIEADIRQSGEPYRLSLPLLVRLRGGSTVAQTVEIQGAQTPLRLRLPAPPARLLLDPEGILPLSAPPDTPPNTDLNTYEFPEDLSALPVPSTARAIELRRAPRDTMPLAKQAEPRRPYRTSR